MKNKGIYRSLTNEQQQQIAALAREASMTVGEVISGLAGIYLHRHGSDSVRTDSDRIEQGQQNIVSLFPAQTDSDRIEPKRSAVMES